jgi:hypothetical protein
MFVFGLQAQIDTTQTNNLLNDISRQEKLNITLLPKKMIFTQRLLWGNNGLMRNFKSFQLNPTERQKELKIREVMLTTHQILGMITMAEMIAQGIIGTKLYNGNTSLKELHEGLAGAINITYFTTAGLVLFAPPKIINERKGYSSIKVHRLLAIVHFSAMITTNILADQLESNPKLRPYHRAAAFTAFSALATAMIVIKF